MSHRRRPDLVTDAERITGDRSPGRTPIFQERPGFQLRRPLGGQSSVSRSVETIPESVEAKVRIVFNFFFFLESSFEIRILMQVL